MKCKKALPIILVSTLLLLLTNATAAEPATSETWTVYYLKHVGLEIEIEAPCQANPGENLTLTIRTKAYNPAGIHVERINGTIYGLVNGTDQVSLKSIEHLEDYPLRHNDVHEVDYVVILPNDTSPGLTYGVVSCKWESEGATLNIPSSGFIVTYVTNEELVRLQEQYAKLNATYQSLLGNFTELDSEYAVELNGAKNLMYVFVVTTVVAGATVLVLIMRRPRTYW